MKYFIVIDMQNDFCTGSLANPDAVAIIPKIKEHLKEAQENKWKIIFTQDTHEASYLNTNEGKHLPVEHCIEDSEGWEIVPELEDSITNDDLVRYLPKEHFGYDHWSDIIKSGDEVVICGTVASICVAANVSALKMIEGVEVTVLKDCIADISDEMKNAALKVMEAQQAIIK